METADSRHFPLGPASIYLKSTSNVEEPKIYSFWADEAAISSVEYALLLAFVGASIIMGAEQLSTAVSDEMIATASCFDGQVDANGGQGGGTGAGGGSGGGSGNGDDQGDGFAIC